MTITPFPKEKVKTPADWQSIYTAEYKQELLRVIPWIMLVPALALCAIVFLFLPSWQDITVGQVARLVLVYLVAVAGLWLAFAPLRPRPNEGEVTREILDASRK